jgi:hypothetical protein
VLCLHLAATSAAASAGSSSLELFGIKFVGITADNGHKLILTLAAVAAFLFLRWLLNGFIRLVVRRSKERVSFWSRQGVSLALSVTLVLTILSIGLDSL